MQILENQNIHKTIAPLYKFARILGIWPYKYDISYKIIPLSTIDKLINHFLNLVVIIYLFWSVYGRVIYVYNKQLTVISCTDIAIGIPLYVLTCISLALSTSNKQRKLKMFFYKEMDSIDKEELKFSNFTHTSLKNQFKLQALISFTLNIVAQAIDFSIHVLVVGFSQVLYYIGNYITHNLMLGVFLQIKFETKLIQQYFEMLNQKLAALAFTTNADESTEDKMNRGAETEVDLKENAANIRKLSLINEKLCNLIEIFNTLHGIQILILVCCIISMILNALFYGLVTGLAHKSSGYSDDSGIAVSCNQVFVGVMHFVLSIIMVGQCASASNEANKSQTIANNMLLRVSMEDKSTSMHLYRRQLKMLREQVHSRNLKFSAAGFFAVDYSTIPTIMGAVCSYFIILLQFETAATQNEPFNSSITFIPPH